MNNIVLFIIGAAMTVVSVFVEMIHIPLIESRILLDSFGHAGYRFIIVTAMAVALLMFNCRGMAAILSALLLGLSITIVIRCNSAVSQARETFAANLDPSAPITQALTKSAYVGLGPVILVSGCVVMLLACLLDYMTERQSKKSNKSEGPAQ